MRNSLGWSFGPWLIRYVLSCSILFVKHPTKTAAQNSRTFCHDYSKRLLGSAEGPTKMSRKIMLYECPKIVIQFAKSLAINLQKNARPRGPLPSCSSSWWPCPWGSWTWSSLWSWNGRPKPERMIRRGKRNSRKKSGLASWQPGNLENPYVKVFWLFFVLIFGYIHFFDLYGIYMNLLWNCLPDFPINTFLVALSEWQMLPRFV